MSIERRRKTIRKTLAVHFSSASVEWSTPTWLFECLRHEFPFSLDSYATPENAKCKRLFTIQDDGLKQHWRNETVFMNPPYGKSIGCWMKKAFESSQGGATVVCLLPARTDTKRWHEYAMRGEIRLLRGRLHFGDAVSPAPFPSPVVIFRPPNFKLRSFSPGMEPKGQSVITEESSVIIKEEVL